jgi:hypothetical protein
MPVVAPIAGNVNFLPLDRGKKISGKEKEKVSFEEYLTENVEPLDEGEHIGEQNKKRSGTETKSDSESEIKTAGETGNESQGGDEEKLKSLRGRRIDLRA